MTEKLIALAVGNNGSLAPHAGRALRWLVYAVSGDSEPSLAWTLDLTDTGCLH